MRTSYLSEFSKFCSFGETNGGLLRCVRSTAIGSTDDLNRPNWHISSETLRTDRRRNL